MGIISKLKSILFEEEPIVEDTKKEKTKRDKKQIPSAKPNLFDVDANPNQPEPVLPSIESPQSLPNPGGAESQLEKTFDFPLFDEAEFENTLPKARFNVQNNWDKKEKRIEKKYEYTHFPKVEEKKKFTPSPIISPVYGILDKDYTKDDIVPKPRENDIPRKRNLTIESVRKKAFGNLEAEIEKTITTPSDEFFNEVEQQLEAVETPLPGKNVEIEVQAESRAITALLQDSAHEEIMMAEPDDDARINDIEQELDKLNEEEIEPPDDHLTENGDTLEQDLFDLIDSIYDDRKEVE